MRALVASGLALIAAAYGLARFGYGLFLPQFTEAFDLGSTIAGAIQAGSFLSYCLAAVVASRMAAHPRALVVSAGTTAALGSAGVALAPTAVVFAVSVVVAGAGAGFATPGLVRLIERNVARARQEVAQTIVNAGTGAGIVAAGVLMFLTIGRWRLGWAAIAVVAALATVATLRSDRAARSGHEVDDSRRLTVADLAPLVRPLAAAALAGASSAAIWTFGRSVLAASRPGEEAYSIVAWMVLGAFGLLGATAGTIVQTWSLRTGWTLTAVLMAVATVMLGLAPQASLAAYAAVALFGASYTALSGVLIVWAVRLLPDRAAEGTVALFIALAVGQAIGSVALGAVLGAAAPALAFALAGAAGIAALLPVLGPAPGRSPAAGGPAHVTEGS
ncbi:MFS transporter [Pseudactinotalea suaedae]|uniref:MFS transporter n=1 Tax=Pseudactinotalea suaedae TaxID=1524924 RepID=UPI0012E1EDF7|nr:MFS transporter [Pseudactinotalea suaedae]